jgi:class 3 adenylate cyclase
VLTVAAAVVAALVIVLAERRRSRRALARVEARLEAASRSLEGLQHAFARFAPATVVDDIIALGVSTRSEKKEVTVLFADLKGFTALAERLDPELLVRVLNGYFERMSAVIRAEQGHVAKFIGDGILALFGAVSANPWQARDAVRAALGMRAALAEYNHELAGEGLSPLAVGIGIHRGLVIAGVIGSAELIEYGVIGSTVNVAARVEELTRVHGVDILVTEPVSVALDGRVRRRAMPPVAVKGVSGVIETFAIEAFDEGRA